MDSGGSVTPYEGGASRERCVPIRKMGDMHLTKEISHSSDPLHLFCLMKYSMLESRYSSGCDFEADRYGDVNDAQGGKKI